jgi:hypothetical protein
MAGRKSLKDELRMFERYSELSVPYFKVLKKHLSSAISEDQKWAVEQLTKAFVKMIPTEITGKDGKDLFPVPILNNMNVPTDNSYQENSPTPKENSGSPGRDISQ